MNFYCVHRNFMRVTLFICSFLFLLTGAVNGAERLSAVPSKVTLAGNFDQTQLLIQNKKGEDFTSRAVYQSSYTKIATINENGHIIPQANGATIITVKVKGHSTIKIPVQVTGVESKPKVGFDLQVRPVLTKLRCNMGGCHSAQFGQAEFKLTVFGYDRKADYDNIVRNKAGRRVNFIEPEKSLFLMKPTMQVSHGGGKRLTVDSQAYKILLEWIRSGAATPNVKTPHVTKVAVTPNQRVATVGAKQQLRVVATYSDGKQKDVTSLAQYDAMDDAVLKTDETGLVEVIGKGQAIVMVRYEEEADIATFVIPYGQQAELVGWKNNNFVDKLAAKKFRELGIEPSPLCDDATFLRRAFLDAIGTLPTIEVTKEFLASKDPKKREKLIDQLLGLTGDSKKDIYNDQYAAYWTLKWSDLIRNQSGIVGEQGMWAFHNWMKESFRVNKPHDKFVYEIVTAKGSIYSNGPANFYRINTKTSDLAEATSQLFMGVRLTCAQCHHHPFQKVGEDDYYKFAAFFSRVKTKKSEEFGIFGKESVVVVKSTGEVRHKRTGKVMKPAPLEGKEVDHPFDRRIPLAKWLTSPQNEYFAKSMVNRYVSYLLGRGLAEPVDDMRQTNPPTNVALMDALAKSFIADKFDIKKLMRRIMVSRLYQLSSQPTLENKSDSKFYSHYKVKRLPAEVLLDAVDKSTNVPTKFKNLPLGTHAIALPDSKYPNYFLKTFGKPKRASVCECERVPDENLSQALHTLNGDILTYKLSNRKSRVATLFKAKKKPDEILNELYLSTLCRYPTKAELKVSHQYLSAEKYSQATYEDLHWALLNSKQFLFIR
ncbi:similar to surface protein [hydrothermal vent metagenome]|uniref:Similar to surface protein n=1 Tax=hydrothermal vent metagenome TaxID=652676 RepID=A0A3B1D3P5_9ZZZZ